MQEVRITVLKELRDTSEFQTVSFEFDRACAALLDDYRYLSPREQASVKVMTAEEYRLELPDDFEVGRAAALDRSLRSGAVQAKGYTKKGKYEKSARVRMRDLLAEAKQTE